MVRRAITISNQVRSLRSLYKPSDCRSERISVTVVLIIYGGNILSAGERLRNQVAKTTTTPNRVVGELLLLLIYIKFEISLSFVTSLAPPTLHG